MEVHCIHCRRCIPRQFIENHQAGPRCRADTTARILLAPPCNLRPYPVGHDLPDCIPMERHVTRARHEGQRLDESGAVLPAGRRFRTQVWVPAWVDVIVEAWMRAGRAHKNRRDQLLCALVKQPPSILHTLFTQAENDGEVIALAQSLAIHPAGAVAGSPCASFECVCRYCFPGVGAPDKTVRADLQPWDVLVCRRCARPIFNVDPIYVVWRRPGGSRLEESRDVSVGLASVRKLDLYKE